MSDRMFLEMVVYCVLPFQSESGTVESSLRPQYISRDLFFWQVHLDGAVATDTN